MKIKLMRHARVFVMTLMLLTGMVDSAPNAFGSPVGLELEERRSSIARGWHIKRYPQAVDNSHSLLIKENKHLWITHSKQLITLTWATKEIKPFLKIIYRESRWNPNAYNPATNAYGLGQLINSKRYTHNMPYKQINAAVKYIAHRYGTPTKAYQHHLKHGWY